MSKIAILYSGFLRNLPETLENNIKCLSDDGDEVSLYFSLWDKMGYVDSINSPDFIRAKRLISADRQVTINLLLNEVVPADFNICDIKIDSLENTICQMDLVNGTKQDFGGQFYKILDCFNLIDSDENYDYLIRMRCDMLLNNKMNNIIDVVNDNKIIFSSKIWYNHEYQKGYRSINDMMWISNKENMRKTCNIYNNVDEINKIIYKKNQSELNYGENICFMNLEVEGLVDSIYTHDFNYNILR